MVRERREVHKGEGRGIVFPNVILGMFPMFPPKTMWWTGTICVTPYLIQFLIKVTIVSIC